MKQLGLEVNDLFLSEDDLLKKIVLRDSQLQLDISKEISDAELYYQKLSAIAGKVDPTLARHVNALQQKALKPLLALEKKLVRAEKRKFSEEKTRIHQLKYALFPKNGLQERVENFLPYYAKYGVEFLTTIYKNSLTLEQEFVVLEV